MVTIVTDFGVKGSFTTVRESGWDVSQRGDNGLPHVVRPPQQANAMRYQVAGGKIFAGLTRVVWELEEVKSGARCHLFPQWLA